VTETKTIIEALRSLAKDYKGFGGEEKVVLEAADRLEKQQKRIRNQRREIEALQKDKKRVDGFVNWLNAEIEKCQHPMSDALSNRLWALLESRKQLQKLRNGLGEQ
jgi:predicted RNase H-like nuclease (RuvC/YqgF family)